MTVSQELDVTLAICTWNRSELLRGALQALVELDRPPSLSLEVLVVLNACTDDSPDTLAFAESLPLRCSEDGPAGLSRARNRVLQEARGSWIVFLDDDVRVSPDWLQAFWSTAGRYPRAGAIGGPIDARFLKPPDPVLWEAFGIIRGGFCAMDHERPEGPLPADLWVFGANFAVRRDAVGDRRFNVELGRRAAYRGAHEEIDFLRELVKGECDIIWSPAMRVEHLVDESRLTLGCLRRYYIDVAQSRVLLDGSGSWWRAAVELRRCIANRYRAVVARNRVDSLRHMRDYWNALGSLRGCLRYR